MRLNFLPVQSKKIAQNLKNFVVKIPPRSLISIGMLLMSISILHWVIRYRTLALSEELVAQYGQSSQQDIAKIPEHIFIQWFVDIGIEEQVYQNATWTNSEKAASHLAQSATPGETGNIIIYGHNKRNILGNIRALKGGETIVITTKDKTEYKYQVIGLHEVSPNQTQFLEPTNEEILTIYTCSGFMDKNRFIVQAEPVKSE